MKMRNGFVSNSSSSSFIIDREHVTPAQIKLIHNHLHKARKAGLWGSADWERDSDAWLISETPSYIMGSTMMDNFDMAQFLKHIGIPDEAVTFENHMADWHACDDEGESLL